MLIPIGAIIDRKTGEIIPQYADGTASDLDALVIALADAGKKISKKPVESPRA